MHMRGCQQPRRQAPRKSSDVAVGRVAQPDGSRLRVHTKPAALHVPAKGRGACTPHLILVMPRLVATTSMGAMSLSRARLRKEKHSMSSMCTCSRESALAWLKRRNSMRLVGAWQAGSGARLPTAGRLLQQIMKSGRMQAANPTSSMNNTPGTISALPSSRHSATLPSICSRTCTAARVIGAHARGRAARRQRDGAARVHGWGAGAAWQRPERGTSSTANKPRAALPCPARAAHPPAPWLRTTEQQQRRRPPARPPLAGFLRCRRQRGPGSPAAAS